MSGESEESGETQPPTSAPETVQPLATATVPQPSQMSGRGHHIEFRFLEELKRRNVGRVAILYLVVCWLILEPVHVIFHMLEVPVWANRLVIILMALGFPAVTIFAWVYEITPEGLKPTAEIPNERSVRRQTGRRLDRAIIAVLVLALTYFVMDKFWLSKRAAEEKPIAAAVPATVPGAPTPPGTLAIPEKSVAVLPFVDMSEKKDQEYFSDGMSEELIDMLTKIPDLRVPARTSSFYFKGRSEDIPTIARRLLVAHVLEGSVRKSGRNLRITVQLVRADNGYHLWSETYDRTLDDTFKIQDEIAGAVVKALKVSLFAAAVPRAAVTSNTDAYTLYLQGRAIFMRADTLAELENAADYFRRAIKDDPTFATAWAYLSRVHMWEWGAKGIQVASVDGRQEAERALALDPNLSQAHVALGSIYVNLDWNWVAAAAEFKKALEIDPGDTSAMQFSAYLTLLLGGHDDTAQKLYLRSIELNPIDETSYSGIASFYFATGNLSGAEAALRKGLDLRPTAWGYHKRLALSRLERGEPAQALVECGLEPEETAHRICLTLAYYGAGRKAESDAALSEVETKDAADAAFSIAEVRAYRGENDRAFAWLDRAYHQHDTGLPGVSRDPLFKNLKSDPRYKALLRKLKLPE